MARLLSDFIPCDCHPQKGAGKQMYMCHLCRSVSSLIWWESLAYCGNLEVVRPQSLLVKSRGYRTVYLEQSGVLLEAVVGLASIYIYGDEKSCRVSLLDPEHIRIKLRNKDRAKTTTADDSFWIFKDESKDGIDALLLYNYDKSLSHEIIREKHLA